MPTLPQKIPLGEMRLSGVRGLLIYCADYRCSHSIAISADRWPDDVRLSLEYCPHISTGVVLGERVVGKAMAVSNQSRQSADSVQPGQLFEAQHLTHFGHLACWRLTPSAQTIAH